MTLSLLVAARREFDLIRRWALTLAVVFAWSLAPVGPSPIADAAPSSGTQQRIDELRGLIGEASAQEAVLLEELLAIVSHRQELDVRLAEMDTQVAEATRKLGVADVKLDALEVSYLELEGRLEETRAQIDVAQDTFDETIRRLYRGGGDSPDLYVSMVIDSETPRDFFSASRYLEATIKRQQQDIDDLLTLRKETKSLQDELDAQRMEAREVRSDAAEQRQQLTVLRENQATARSAAAKEEASERAVLARIRARKSEFTKELDELQRESGSIGDLLRDRQDDQIPPPSGNGIFLVPVNARITSPFGPRVHPIFGDSRMHNGLDFGAGAGTAIRAAGSGKVIWAGPRGGYGNTVIIDHGNTLATLYAHQSRLAVSSGDQVSKGDVVGYVGSTGYSTGPHLHFEVRRSGTPVDPMPYL